MKRTGFKPRAQHREQRDPDRVRSVPTVAPGAFRAPEPVSEAPAAQVAKAAPVRSEPYRRAVATLPCAICGVHGYSQAAHANQGKGMGMKACDLTIELWRRRRYSGGCRYERRVSRHPPQTTTTKVGRNDMANKQDIKYAQDMIPHHESAVSMSATEWTSGESQELKNFALKVFAKQREEIEFLKDWLKRNGASEKSSSAAGMIRGLTHNP